MPKKTILATCAALWFTLCAVAQKNQPGPKRKYINNDSTDIFSTHPSRPFMYGYALNKFECKRDHGYLLNALDPQKGEKIAEVGAASGWIMGALSVFTDGVEYYVQDIDSNYSNPQQMQKVVEHFSKVRGTPQTNTFHFVLGDMRCTHLPDGTFDKIVVNNSFHEMTKASEMIADMKKKLAPGGMIVINEVYANRYRKVKHNGCNIPARTVDQMNGLFEEHGLYLVKTSSPLSSIGNILFYSTDKTAHETFMKKAKSVQTYTDNLLLLAFDGLSKDPAMTMECAKSIKAGLEKINAVFPDTETCFEKLGYQYGKEKKHLQAAHVFEAYSLVYPHSYDAWLLWGDALTEAKKLGEAIEVYSNALKLFPDSTELYDSRSFAFSEMDSLGLALKDLNKAIELGGKELGYFYYQRGLLYTDMGQREEARTNFERAIQINPKRGDAYFDLAEWFLYEAQYEEAIETYTRIIAIDPESIEAYGRRAQIKRLLGDKEGYRADAATQKRLRKGK